MERNFCLLIIFTCSLFAQENFWFSYKIATKNNIVIFEERNISPQMQMVNANDYKFLCKLDAKKNQYQSIISFLNKNYDKLLTCFYPFNSQIISQSLIETKGMVDLTILTIIPIKFTVDFKDDFANINTIK